MSVEADVDVHYHKCSKCSGSYFLPCGCAIGHTWCSDCREHQEQLKAAPMPVVDLSEDKNVSVMLSKLRLG